MSKKKLKCRIERIETENMLNRRLKTVNRISEVMTEYLAAVNCKAKSGKTLHQS